MLQTMKNKALRDALAEFPDDANVELGKFIAVVQSDEHPPAAKGDTFELILDFPILGLAHSDADNDLRLVVEAAPALMKFGRLRRLA